MQNNEVDLINKVDLIKYNISVDMFTYYKTFGINLKRNATTALLTTILTNKLTLTSNNVDKKTGNDELRCFLDFISNRHVENTLYNRDLR